MRCAWRLQFGMRTLLVAMLALGMAPWLGVRWHRWREAGAWKEMDSALRSRDEALDAWRTANRALGEGKADGRAAAKAEAAAREEYFAAREEVDHAMKSLERFYQFSPEQLQRAGAFREHIQRVSTAN